MTAVTIHNLSARALCTLRLRALENSRSCEAELREILEAALAPKGRLHIGSALSGLSEASGLSNSDIEALENARDTSPPAPMWFG